MATEGIEVVLRWFRAFTEGRAEAALELATDDLVIDMSNSRGPLRGAYHGKVGARELWASFREVWGDFEWTVVEARSLGGDHVAVGTRLKARGGISGIELHGSGGWLITWREGKVSEGVLHQSFDDALVEGRRQLLAGARLYFVCDGRPRGENPRPLLEAALAGGADLIQLRDKSLGDDELVDAARSFRAAADEHGALFILNDRPDLVVGCDADGVHVGQDDPAVGEARRAAGAGAVVGLSTHTPEQVDAAVAAGGDQRPDQISVGPVWDTPTKEGRPAAGLELIEHTAATAGELPWFAIGGIDAANLGEVVRAGASRIVVVRAIRDAADPERVARELRAALE